MIVDWLFVPDCSSSDSNILERCIDSDTGYFLKEVKVYLTSTKGAQIIKNPLLTYEQKYYQLYKQKCMFSSAHSKFITMPSALHVMQLLDDEDKLEKSLQCNYCSDYINTI